MSEPRKHHAKWNKTEKLSVIYGIERENKNENKTYKNLWQVTKNNSKKVYSDAYLI